MWRCRRGTGRRRVGRRSGCHWASSSGCRPLHTDLHNPDPADLTDSILRVGNGGSAIDPVVIEHLLKRRHADGPLAALTNRERDVLAVMAEDRSNHSIATKLHISEKTVEACTGRIFAKLGLEPGPDDHRRVRAALT